MTCVFGPVQEYTPSGSLFRNRPIYIGFDDKWQAVELNSGMLAVSRYGPVHGIAMMSMDCRVIQSYGNKSGSGVGQMNNPYMV